MVNNAIPLLAAKYRSAKAKLHPKFVSKLSQAVLVKQRWPLIYQRRIFTGGQLTNACINIAIWKKYPNKTVAFLGKMSGALVSRGWKFTIVQHSGTQDVEVTDLYWAIDALRDEGEDVMEIVEDLLEHSWDWANSESGCRDVIDTDITETHDQAESLLPARENKCIWMVTTSRGIKFLTDGLLPLDLLTAPSMRSISINKSLYRVLQDAALDLIQAGYDWNCPPTKKGKVVLNVAQIKARAFLGDAGWYWLVLDAIKGRFPRASRLFTVMISQVANSNETTNALMRTKRELLPNGGAGLTVHEGGSYFEGMTGQSIVESNGDIKPARRWANETLKRLLEHLRDVFKNLMDTSDDPPNQPKRSNSASTMTLNPKPSKKYLQPASINLPSSSTVPSYSDLPATGSNALPLGSRQRRRTF